MIAGVPVGKELPVEQGADIRTPMDDEMGSIIVVIATDAPLLPHQLERVATRAGLGIARVGGMASNGSGDIFIAFSTANAHGAPLRYKPVCTPDGQRAHISPIFVGAALATEEAIVNAMIAAETMTGRRGNTVPKRSIMPRCRMRSKNTIAWSASAAMESTSSVLVTLVIYNALLIGVGLWARGRNQSVGDYFLAGRGLGAHGWPQSVPRPVLRQRGPCWVSAVPPTRGVLPALWIFPSTVGGFLLNWVWVAPRLKRLATEEQAVTLSEVIVPTSIEPQSPIVVDVQPR